MLQILLLLGPLLLHNQASLAAPLGNCTQTCGGITIPFPFGIGAGCFLDEWYEIVCQNRTVPILIKPNLRVLNISLPDYYSDWIGTIKVSLPITYSSNASCGSNGSSTPVSLKGSPFIFSTSQNIFAAVGCNADAQVYDTGSTTVRCNSSCRADNDVVRNVTCSGSDGCCQTEFTTNFQAFTINFLPHNETAEDNECSYAFLGDRSQFTPSVMDFNKLKASGHFAAVLEWGIGNSSKAALEIYNSSSIHKSYRCYPFSVHTAHAMDLPFCQCLCSEGFTGNPYIKDGCKGGSKKIKFLLIGVGSGLGALFLCLTLWRLYKYIKKIKETKLKEKYFKRNGGLLLERDVRTERNN